MPPSFDELRVRLASTRWSANAPADLRELVRYWHTDFDWRARERELGRYPHHRVTVDGAGLHVVRVPGRGPAPLPLVLTHGWPSTFYEFWPVISRLTDPGRHGGDPADAFDVVVPSLPGFAYSPALAGAGSSNRIPHLWHLLMTEIFGYARYGAHGGDIGAMVTNRLALEHPHELAGIHVTMPAEPHADPATLTDEEQRFLRERIARQESGGAYAHVHRTRPDTLAVALHDSPAGLAAWIVEKWREWSDPMSHLAADDLLTTLTLYWLTDSIGTSLRVYRDWALGSAGRPEAWSAHVPSGVDSRPLAPGELITVPAGLCLFGTDVPRSWADRAYADLRHWVRAPRGGHFPAMEVPDLLAEDLRTFFRPLR